MNEGVPSGAMPPLTPTPDINALMQECEHVHTALWECNTRGAQEPLYEEVEDAIEHFQSAVRRITLSSEELQAIGILKMLSFTARLDKETVRQKTDAVGILFQEMRLKLKYEFSDAEKPSHSDPVPTNPKKLHTLDTQPMMRCDMERLVHIGEKMKNPLLTEDQIRKHCISERGDILLGLNGYAGEIASYAICKTEKRGIHLKEVKAVPEYQETYARKGLLRQFGWWIPHCVLRGMQKYLTTAPIDIQNVSESDFYAAENFVTYGGERDDKGELTHIRMGKLTDEFNEYGV